MCTNKALKIDAKMAHHMADVAKYRITMEKVLDHMNLEIIECKRLRFTLATAENNLGTYGKVDETLKAFGFAHHKKDTGVVTEYVLLNATDEDIDRDAFINKIIEYCDGNLPETIEAKWKKFNDNFDIDELRRNSNEVAYGIIDKLMPDIQKAAEVEGKCHFVVDDEYLINTSKIFDTAYVRNTVIDYLTKKRFSVAPSPDKESHYGFTVLW